MYIFFDEENNVSETHLLESFRQGNINANHIYVTAENYNNLEYLAFIQFERPDGTKTPEIPMAQSDFQTSNQVQHNGFKYTINDPYILEQHGQLKVTVRYRNSYPKSVATGTVIIPVIQTVYEAEPTITASQYNILLSYFDKYLPKVSRSYPHIVSELPSNIAEYLTQGQIIADIPEDLTDYEVGAILFVGDDVYEIYDDGGTKDIRLLDTLENYLVGTIFIVLTESVFELHKVVSIDQTELITSTQVHEYLDRATFPEEGRANHLYIDATESHIYFCDENYTYRLIGTKAVDVKTAYSPLNYYVDEANVDSHFNGIDDKFSKIADGTSLVGKAVMDEKGYKIHENYGNNLYVDDSEEELKLKLRTKLNIVLSTLSLRKASQTKDGVMSKDDKKKLDELPTNANLGNTYLQIANIIDNLISTDTTKPLSANQGKVLKGQIDTIQNLLESDDVSLDELQEIVAYIKTNKSLIDGITINKVSVADIIDNLVTQVATKPLSAKQGYVLDQKLVSFETRMTGAILTVDAYDNDTGEITFGTAYVTSYDGTTGEITFTI